MKNMVSLFFVIVTFVSISALASYTYKWAGNQSGIWNDAANWTSTDGGTSYPGEGDKIGAMPWTSGDGYTITLQNDVSVSSMSLDANSGKKTFDLNGNKLTISTGTGLYFRFGSTPSFKGDIDYTSGLLLKNGSFESIVDLGTYSQAPYSVLDLSNVAFSGHVRTWNGNSRVIVRDATEWNLTSNTRTEPGYYHNLANAKYACLCITGMATKVESSSFDLTIGGIDGSARILDGATAAYKNIFIGGTTRADGCELHVDNAEVTVINDLHLGSDVTNVNEATAFLSYKAESKKSLFTLKGEGASVEIGNTLFIYEKTGAALRYEIPQNGYKDEEGNIRTPLSAYALEVYPRDVNYEDFGPTSLEIDCYEWVKANPETTIPLISFEEASDEFFDELTNNVVWVNYPSSLSSEGYVPVFSVSQDGTTLSITSPKIRKAPAFAAEVSPGSSAGMKNLGIVVYDYGYEATAITDIECMFSDDASFSSSQALKLISEDITEALPLTLSYVLDGSFVQYRRYYVRVKITNDSGESKSVDLEFLGDGTVEEYTWCGTSGIWQDVSCWTVDGAAAADYPRSEDSILWPYVTEDYTIKLTEDVSLVSLPVFSSASRIVTMDLNGNTLNLTGTGVGDNNAIAFSGWQKGTENVNYCGSVFVISNGTCTIPTYSNGNTSGIMMGYAGSSQGSSCGTLVLLGGSELIADIKYLNNSSRVFVGEGSVWRTVMRGLTYQHHTAISPHPFVCVTGLNSRIEMPSHNFTVRGMGSALYLFDGAKFNSMNLYVGNMINCECGSVESTNTLVLVDNSTLKLGGNMALGWEDDVQCTPRLVIQGENSSVDIASELKLYDSIGASVEFNVPHAGYSKTPLTVGSFTIAERADAAVDFGAAKIKVNAKSWMKANAGGKMTLVKLDSVDFDALNTMKERIELDYKAVPSERLVEVSEDGTELLLKGILPGFSIFVR